MRQSFSRMRHRDRRRAGLLLFAGSIGFAIGMTLAEATFPGYNVAHDFLGDLGVGPSALLFNASIVFLGAAFLPAAGFLARAFRPRRPARRGSRRALAASSQPCLRLICPAPSGGSHGPHPFPSTGQPYAADAASDVCWTSSWSPWTPTSRRSRPS